MKDIRGKGKEEEKEIETKGSRRKVNRPKLLIPLHWVKYNSRLTIKS
jgi:hypothetical protein